MENYGPSTYGDRIADVYDELFSHLSDVSAVVDLLAGLAEKGRALGSRSAISPTWPWTGRSV